MPAAGGDPGPSGRAGLSWRAGPARTRTCATRISIVDIARECVATPDGAEPDQGRRAGPRPDRPPPAHRARSPRRCESSFAHPSTVYDQRSPAGLGHHPPGADARRLHARRGGPRDFRSRWAKTSLSRWASTADRRRALPQTAAKPAQAARVANAPRACVASPRALRTPDPPAGPNGLRPRFLRSPHVPGRIESVRALRAAHLALCLVLIALALLGVAAPAAAVDAVRVNRDVTAIDLTPAIERYRSDGDVIQISTAPGPDGIVRRIAVRAREAGTRAGLDRVRADQRRRRADRPAARRLAFPPLGLRRDLAGPRRLAHRRDHREPGHPPRQAARSRGRPLPPSRSTRAPPSPTWRSCATPSVPRLFLLRARRLPRQGERADALRGDHHRHRRVAGAVPHRDLRRQGRPDLSRRRGAGLGRCSLMRASISASSNAVFPPRRERRAGLPGSRRGDPGGDAARLPVRLSQPQPLARALRARDALVARLPRRARRARGHRSAGGGGSGAHLARRRRGHRLRARCCISPPRATTGP